MSRRTRVCGMLIVMCALSVGLYVAPAGHAGDAKKLAAEVNKIADMLEKGDKAGAEKAATALAKKLEDVIEVMDLFKPRNKGGIGVGKPGTVVPDGIEQFLLKIGRDTPTTKEMKDPGALARMAYVTGAIAEVAHAKPPARDLGKKTKKAWMNYAVEFRESWQDMTTAAKSKSAAAVKAAAVKMNSSCANCHSVFK